MKFRGLLSVVAALTLVCTLGCPPAEEGDVPAEINTTEPAGDNATETGDAVDAPAPEGDGGTDAVEEVPPSE